MYDLSYHFAILMAFIETKPGNTEKVNMNENTWDYCPAINNIRLCITYQVSSHFAMYQMFVMLNIDRRWPSLGQGPLKQMDGIATKCWFSKRTLCRLPLAFPKL